MLTQYLRHNNYKIKNKIKADLWCSFEGNFDFGHMHKVHLLLFMENIKEFVHSLSVCVGFFLGSLFSFLSI